MERILIQECRQSIHTVEIQGPSNLARTVSFSFVSCLIPGLVTSEVITQNFHAEKRQKTFLQCPHQTAQTVEKLNIIPKSLSWDVIQPKGKFHLQCTTFSRYTHCFSVCRSQLVQTFGLVLQTICTPPGSRKTLRAGQTKQNFALEHCLSGARSNP